MIGLLHTPYGRPLMRRLGVACPAAKVSPGEVEAVRLRAVAALRTEVPSPARPAVGQTLDVSRAADVTAWARARGLACVESARPSHTIRCEGRDRWENRRAIPRCRRSIRSCSPSHPTGGWSASIDCGAG